MKLVHPDMEMQIQFDVLSGCEWIIEPPESFARYVEELYAQSEGAEGRFVLSESDRELAVSKSAEVIINPFSVNINDKKVINKLYAELSETAYGEEMFLKTQELTAYLQNYFLHLEHLQVHMLEADLEIDMTALFKAMGVRLCNFANDFFENLNQYVKILAELMRKKLIVFVNVGSYLSEVQIEQLLETASYHEIAVLFMESRQKSFSNKVRQYIIDSDYCEIF